MKLSIIPPDKETALRLRDFNGSLSDSLNSAVLFRVQKLNYSESRNLHTLLAGYVELLRVLLR